MRSEFHQQNFMKFLSLEGILEKRFHAQQFPFTGKRSGMANEVPAGNSWPTVKRSLEANCFYPIINCESFFGRSQIADCFTPQIFIHGHHCHFFGLNFRILLGFTTFGNVLWLVIFRKFSSAAEILKCFLAFLSFKLAVPLKPETNRKFSE